MIKTFKHKGLEYFIAPVQLPEYRPSIPKRLRIQLSVVDTAQEVEDVNLPGFRLHKLKGIRAGQWSITVNGNWRLTFEFRERNAYILNYEDYH